MREVDDSTNTAPGMRVQIRRGTVVIQRTEPDSSAGRVWVWPGNNPHVANMVFTARKNGPNYELTNELFHGEDAIYVWEGHNKLGALIPVDVPAGTKASE